MEDNPNDNQSREASSNQDSLSSLDSNSSQGAISIEVSIQTIDRIDSQTPDQNRVQSSEQSEVQSSSQLNKDEEIISEVVKKLIPHFKAQVGGTPAQTDNAGGNMGGLRFSLISFTFFI